MIVHIDNALVQDTAAAIRRNGHRATGFTDPVVALHAIEIVPEPPALVAGIRFGAGKLHGIALGLMARRKHPGAVVLLIAGPEDIEHARGVGHIIPAGSSPQAIADALQAQLAGG